MGGSGRLAGTAERRVHVAADALVWKFEVKVAIVFGAAQGRGVGAKLGAPTAHVLPESPVMPPTGVYAVDAAVRAEDGVPALRPRRAVANFGFRPTFPDARPDRPVLEIFIPGFEGELHGRALDVTWRRRLRGERTFESPAALAAQIRADAEEALRP